MSGSEPWEIAECPADTDPGIPGAVSAACPGDGPMHEAVKEDDPMSVMATRREVMPETRQSRTHKFMIGGHEGYLTVGLFPDGRPGEIFIKMSKEGSTLSGLIQGFCRAFSLALQHGLNVRDASDRFRGMRFEPMGPTSNPDIPEASSILDYVARYLQVNFCERD
jgi:ribonucleoside-diphosphate reductase alpha chain